MPDGETTNTAADAATQGSGQTPASGAGATTQAANASTPTAQEQAAQPSLLHLTQSQLDELIQGRVQRAVRADRRQRAQAPDKAAPAPEGEASDTDELRTQLERIQAQLAQRDAELAAERRAALVAKVAGKHKLPAEIADLLQGATEADLEAHAAKLAKLIGPPPAPRTEAGGGAKPAVPPPSGPPAVSNGASPSYPFQSPGDVAW